MDIIKWGLVTITPGMDIPCKPSKNPGEDFGSQFVHKFELKGNIVEEHIGVALVQTIGNECNGMYSKTIFHVEFSGDFSTVIEAKNEMIYASLYQMALGHARILYAIKNSANHFGNFFVPVFSHEDLVNLIRQSKREALN